MRQKILRSAFALSFLLSACEPDASIELEARTQVLQVNATITSIEFDFDDGKATYRANANISNTTDETQVYSNKWLWLESGRALKSRAYRDSVASHQVDFGSIDLSPNENVNLDIYWVFQVTNLKDPATIRLFLSYDHRNSNELEWPDHDDDVPSSGKLSSGRS